MLLTLGEKQLTSISEADGRVNAWVGSVRSGKTIASLLRFLLQVALLAESPQSGEVVIVGRTRDSVWRNVIAPMQDPALFDDVAAEVKGNYGAPSVEILGRRCYVMGASDNKAEPVLRGLTVLLAYVDEVTTLPEQFFSQLLARMSPPGATMFATTNPDHPYHWFRVKYLLRTPSEGDHALKDWRVWSFILDDNPGLSESYKNSLKSELTGLWYERFVMGRWVAGSGAVFDGWDADKHTGIPGHIVRTLALGVDYGTTNPTAAVLLGLDDHGVLWALDEWRTADRRMQGTTLADVVDALVPWSKKVCKDNYWPPPEHWIADPSAADLRTQLSSVGVYAAPGNNDVTYGLRTMASLFGQQQLRIATSCTALLKELPGYSWDEKASLGGEDKPIKKSDHSIDALRYALVTTETLWRRHVRSPE